MSKNILIIGYGNVGKAICKIEEEAGNNVYILEKDFKPEKVEYDVCHITIPYSKDYVKIITDYLRGYIPKLVIIHTTILFDVLKKVKQITGLKIVYAPVNSPNNSNEEIVYKDKKEKPTNIIGYNIDVKYSKQHLEDILSSKIIYSVGDRYKKRYSSYNGKKEIEKKNNEKYLLRNVVDDIQKKLKNPHKKIGKYY